jgi:hypothetical protein
MSFKTLVSKLVKEGKSEVAAKKIAGSIANAKMKGAGSGPTAAQKARAKGGPASKATNAAYARSKGRTASKATNAAYARSKGLKMKSDSKEMKPHNMYGSGGVVKFVKTMKEHLALKKKGYGHTKKK